MRQRSISLRSAASPAASTLAHCPAVSRIERCASISAAGFGGLPSGFLEVFIFPLSVVLKCFTTMIFCDTITPVKTPKNLKLRIKDKHARVLGQMAREVNQVFNFCNETSSRATVQLVCAEYATWRKQFKKTGLNWRVSNPKSSRYSLGWVPCKGGHAKYRAGQIGFAGQKFNLWDSHGLGQYELRSGSFSQDARPVVFARVRRGRSQVVRRNCQRRHRPGLERMRHHVSRRQARRPLVSGQRKGAGRGAGCAQEAARQGHPCQDREPASARTRCTSSAPRWCRATPPFSWATWLLSGWAFRFKTLSDGRRQILSFLMPGDFIGMQQKMLDAAAHGVTTLTRAVFCVFQRDACGRCTGSRLRWASTSLG